MAKKERNEKRSQLFRELLAELKPTSAAGLQGSLKEMFGGMLEEMLKAELDEELGYEKHDQTEKATSNRRNGSYEKQIRSSLGEQTLSVPRDRQGLFEPQVVPNGVKDVTGIEEKVLSMYAKGMSDRDISYTINDIYGFEMSHDTISRIVDKITPKLTEWQSRPLEERYSFLYMDALMVDIKSDGKAMKKAVYSIIGINEDGKKDVLGFWISENEGSHFWLSILDELKNRGVKKVFFACIDGLSGLEEAIKTVFPETIVQRCMVHLVRSSVKYIPTKHYKEFCSDLKAIYQAVSLSAAQAAFESLKEKWGKNYPGAIKVWMQNFSHVEQLFNYPAEIRKMIYTTNMIEAFNSALRKVTNRKAAFPNNSAVLKILFLRTIDITKKWTAPVQNWAIIRGRLDVLFNI